jgi:hypothetical protein
VLGPRRRAVSGQLPVKGAGDQPGEERQQPGAAEAADLFGEERLLAGRQAVRGLGIAGGHQPGAGP